MAWRWAAAVRLTMCALDGRRLVWVMSLGFVLILRWTAAVWLTVMLQIAAVWFGACGIGEELSGTLLLIYMEHCCRTFECRREHLLITCLLTAAEIYLICYHGLRKRLSSDL